MSENAKNMEAASEQEAQSRKGRDPVMEAIQAADTVSKGKVSLIVPIQDGEKTYDTLQYDFCALSAWELAKAIDAGTTTPGNGFALTDTQALAIFAAAAAKCTGGLDARDILERLASVDGIAATRAAKVFFRGSSLAGSLRYTRD